MSPRQPRSCFIKFRGDLLRAKREEFGVTQAALATELCCSDRLIWRWESGSTIPHVSAFLVFNRMFNMRLEDWFEVTDSK